MVHRLAAAVAIGVVIALLPAAALAQAPGITDGALIRIDGDYTVGEGASIETLIVVNGDATVAGTAKTVVVINGDAHIAGEVTDHVTVVRGTLDLSNTAVVNDVLLVRGDLERMQGSVVRGGIERQGAWLWPGAAILLGVIFIVGSIVIAFVAAVVFATLGGRQLGDAAAGMTERPGQSVGFGLGTAILGPVIAGLFMATVIGIPVGLTILLVVLPGLGLLGAVTAATWIGFMILNRGDTSDRSLQPLGPALLGLAIMAALMLVPGIGFLAVVLLAIWGMGALADRAFRGARSAPPPDAQPGPEDAPAPTV